MFYHSLFFFRRQDGQTRDSADIGGRSSGFPGRRGVAKYHSLINLGKRFGCGLNGEFHVEEPFHVIPGIAIRAALFAMTHYRNIPQEIDSTLFFSHNHP